VSVADVMSENVVTCRPFDTLLDATRAMLDAGAECVAVVAGDGSQRVVGALTYRDVVTAAAHDGRPLAEIQVRAALCSTPTLCESPALCAPEDSLTSTLERMRAHGRRHLAVADREGRLCGVVSLQDIATAVTRKGASEALPSQLQVCRTLAESGRAGGGTTPLRRAGGSE